jgi:hypothetical protein
MLQVTNKIDVVGDKEEFETTKKEFADYQHLTFID